LEDAELTKLEVLQMFGPGREANPPHNVEDSRRLRALEEFREGLARDGQFFRAEPAFPDPIRIHNGERGTTVRDVEADRKRIQQSPEDQQGIRFR
jgi:hypothetical protein